MLAFARFLALPLLIGCGTAPSPATSPAPDADPSTTLKQSLRARPLELTRHARCRMDCRDVTQAEIEQLLVDGTWVPERTRHDGECPSHALEGRSADGQSLRVVYAACADTTRVVTAIDLGAEHDCSCD